MRERSRPVVAAGALLAILAFPPYANAQAKPSIGKGGVVSAASYKSEVAPCSIAAIFGDFGTEQNYAADRLPLPRKLGSREIQANGTPIPMFFASSTQINAQVPCEISGTVAFMPILNGIAGNSEAVTISAAAPGIFTLNQQGTGPAAALKADYKPVNAANPASSGEVILIYWTGGGTTTPAIKTGEATPTGQLYKVNGVTLKIGGKDAQVLFAGAAPGFAGLYQVNATVPSHYSAEHQVQLCQGNTCSQAATIAVKGNQECPAPGIYSTTAGKCIVEYNVMQNGVSVPQTPLTPGSFFSAYVTLDRAQPAGCGVYAAVTAQAGGSGCGYISTSFNTHAFKCQAPQAAPASVKATVGGASNGNDCVGTPGQAAINLQEPPSAAGLVKELFGNPLASIKVTVTNQQTGAKAEGTTGSDGKYRVLLPR